MNEFFESGFWNEAQFELRLCSHIMWPNQTIGSLFSRADSQRPQKHGHLRHACMWKGVHDIVTQFVRLIDGFIALFRFCFSFFGHRVFLSFGSCHLEIPLKIKIA
jgi:hypothetical protein